MAVPTDRLDALLAELVSLQSLEHPNASRAPGSTTSGRSPRRRPVTVSEADTRRANILRDAIVQELVLAAPAEDVSPRAADPRDQVSLPVGERVAHEKPFSKRVFENGIPSPLPSTLRATRFSKRMNIEMAALRNTKERTAMAGRKPEAPSIFSPQYHTLRIGETSNIDSHARASTTRAARPAPTLRDGASGHGDGATSRFPPVPPPRIPEGYVSEYNRTVAVTGAATARVAPRPDRPLVGKYYVPPTPEHPTHVRETMTATGVILERSPRGLVNDPRTAGRGRPATDRAAMLH